jgi:hypothetical protein
MDTDRWKDSRTKWSVKTYMIVKLVNWLIQLLFNVQEQYVSYIQEEYIKLLRNVGGVG